MKRYVLVFGFCCLGNVFFTQAQQLSKKQGTSTHLTSDSLPDTWLDPVVVTGQFEPQSVQNSVYRVRTISNEQIRQRASTTVENILNTQLGIRFSNDQALGESDIELMGMSGRNVKVLLDGVPLVDRGASKQSLSQIDVNLIDRIELIEGPMSVIYGSDALAGVINIITKKGTQDPSFSVSARLQEETVGKEYTPFDREGTHNGNLTLNWQHKAWRVQATGSRNNFGGWQGSSTGRSLDWNPKDQWLLGGTLGYQTDRSNTWYRLDYLDEDIYTPGRLNTGNMRAIDRHFYTRRFTHMLQSDWKLSDRTKLAAVLSYQDYQRQTETLLEDFQQQTSSPTTGAGEQDLSEFTTLMFRATLPYRISQKVYLQPGIEFSTQSGTGHRIEGAPHIEDYAVFLSGEITPWKGVNIRPGLRYINNSIYDAPPIIPSLNIKVSLSESLILRTAYARGFRSPALRELYFTFYDANHSIQGNEHLEAEHSNSFHTYLSWDAGSKHAVRLKATAGGFYNVFDNLIALGIDPNDPSKNTYINVDKFRTTGGTLETNLAWKQVEASLGFSYIGRYNRLIETEVNVPDMTWTPELNATLMYTVPKWDLGVNIFYKFYGKRPVYELSPDDTGEPGVHRAVISGYSNADLSLYKPLTPNLTLVAGVRNLFDITSIRNTALTSEGVHDSPNQSLPISYGRSYYLGFNFSWSKLKN